MVGHDEEFSIDRRNFILGATALGTAKPHNLINRERLLEFESHQEVDGIFSADVPDNISDPHLVSTHGSPPIMEKLGWESTTRDTLTESVLDLGLDVFSVQDLTGFDGPPLEATYAYRHTAIGQFSHRWGLPHSSGFHRILEADTVHDGWYKDLPENDRWEKPNGSVVQHPKELASKDFYGGSHLSSEGSSKIIPSVFAPGTLDIESSTGGQIFKLGTNQLFVDGFELARVNGNDFSVWARTAFEDHLTSLSKNRLNELGIDDPSQFSIRTYLEEGGIAPDSESGNPARDSVYREYTRHHHQQYKRYASKLAKQCKLDAPESVSAAGTTFFGNLAGISAPMPAPIYLSDAVDEIVVEVDPTLPPRHPHDVTVKIGLAAGRFQKPVRIEGKMQKIRDINSTMGLNPEQQYPVLMQLQVGQSYAHGGIRGLSLTGWGDVPEGKVVNNWIRSAGTIDESLQQFTDFIRSSERLLQPVEPANDTVLVVSLPTLIWQRAPQWDRYVPSHTNAVRGAATVLRQEHIPYDVLIFDYPPVWEATEQHELLADYELAVLPGVESISDAQVSSLKTALDQDTTVIATGGGPSRTEEFQSRDDVQTLLQNSAVTNIVTGNPERSGAGQGREAFRSALPTEGRQVELGTDSDISVNVMRSLERDFVVIHLLNFEYDPKTDSTSTRSELKMTIHDLPFEPSIARYYTKSGVTNVDLSSEASTVTLQVPKLDIWGFVVIGEDGSAAAPTTDRSTASKEIDKAKSVVASVKENDRIERLVKAQTVLENANKAYNYGAYTKAHNLAGKAILAAEGTYQRPVIGIDQAHNQSNKYYESDLQTLRETFDSYGYWEITNWTAESFEPLDLLILPPILSEAQVEYGFTTAEIDAVSNFVKQGGSLLLLGTNRTKPGFNRLAGRFGFGLDGRPINKGQGDFWGFEVESPLSELTAFIPTWGGRFGTPLETIEEGTVLGRVRADTSAWLTSEPPIDEQAPDEPSAAGEPVLAGRAFGDGHVVISGEAWQFVDPTTADGIPAPLPEKILRTLGRRARYAEHNQQQTPGNVTTHRSPTLTEVETDTPTPSSTSSPTSEEEGTDTSTESPTRTSGQSGFGVISALIGLVSALSYRLYQDNSSKK